MKEIVLNENQLDEVITKLANRLNEEYLNKNIIPVLVCVLKGAVPFFHDLIKKLKFPLIVDYIQVSSYDGTSSTGVIHLKKDLSENIENKEVLIVEDIIDTGTTLNYLINYIKHSYKPSDVKVVCLIDKKPMRKVQLDADYVGFTLNENKFLVGYGFDYNELERNVPYIYVPDEDDLDRYKKLLNKFF